MFTTKVKAPALTGGKAWLNVNRPITIDELIGKIVLLDFWTFCCADCMHILPYLKKLEAAYPDELVVIGIHSGKFDNERETDSIKKAIERYGIRHPVINDRGYALWESYLVREWPTLILIDPDGYIVKKTPCSENPFGQFDQPIQELIEKFGAEGKLNRSPIENFVWGSNEPAIESSILKFPGKIFAANQLFIADTGNNRVVILEQDGAVADIIGSGAPGNRDGAFERCEFKCPQGLYLTDDQLYIADTENHLIRKADLRLRTVSTIAGTSGQAAYEGAAQQGSALKIPLSSPWDVIRWRQYLFIAMAGTHQLWRLDLEQQVLELFAGTGVESLADGPRKQARLSQPSALSVENDVLYFVDSETSAVRSISLTDESSAVQTLVGKGLFDFGDKDGALSSARLQHPLGIALRNTSIFIADSYNHKIKRIDLTADECKTLCGTGVQGLVDDAPGQLSEPGGLSLFGETLYIADTNNHSIRIFDLNENKLKTLKVHEREASRADQFLPNLTTIKVSQLLLAPDSSSYITLHLELDPDLHLNEEMPVSYTATSSPHLRFKQAQGEFIPGTPIAFSTGSLDQGTSTLGFISLALVLYLCEEQGACHVRSLKFEIPIQLERGASTGSIDIKQSVTVHQAVR